MSRLFALIIALLLGGVVAWADNSLFLSLGDHSEAAAKEAALKKELARAKGSARERMEIYARLAELYYDDVREIPYLNKLKDLAAKNNMQSVLNYAISNIARNYYTRCLKDSLLICMAREEQLIAKSPYLFFQFKFYESRALLRENDFRSAFNVMLEMRKKAEETNDKFGKFRMKCVTAAIYHSTTQYESATNVYKELMESEFSTGTVRSQLFMYIVRAYLRLHAYDEAEAYLKQWAEELNKYGETDKKFPAKKFNWTRKSFLIDLYYRTNRENLAKAEIADLMKVHDYVPTTELLQELVPVCASIELNNGNLEQAGKMINWLLSIRGSNREAWYLSLRAQLYTHLGKKDSAAISYRATVDSMTKILYSSYNRSFDQFHEMAKGFETQKLNTSRQLRQTRIIIIASITILLIIMVGGAFLIRTYLKNRKIRASISEATKSLAAEKDDLQFSDENLEAQLKVAEENNLKEMHFITNMSHEIRTPLNVIYGFTEIIAADPEINAELAEFTSLIMQNCDVIIKLIDEIIEVCKLNNMISAAAINEDDVVEIGRKVLKAMEPLAQRGVRLRIDCPSTPVKIYTDSSKLQQLLTNLLGNACKFTAQGSIILSIKEDAEYVTFSVADTGCGIPKDERDKLFKRYSKLSEIKHGTGLGLYICNEIAKQLNSRIYINPDCCDGSEFVFEHAKNLKSIIDRNQV